MLLLHSIIVLGALLVSSRARSNPYNIAARPDQKESNDNQRISENSEVEDLPREMADTKVCQTEECRRTVQEILRNLNQSVHPCEDFYEYACGGWSQHNPIPANDDMWNQLKKLERRNKKRIREILVEPEEDTDTAAVKAAKRFHQSCMDLDAIEKLGLKPLEQILEANGGWPMIMKKSEWNSRNVSWKKIHENYHLLSRNASLFTVTVDVDLTRNMNVIKLQPRDPMTLRNVLSYTEHSNERSYYAKYAEDVALTFAKSRNSNVSRKQISKDVADMIDFENLLHTFRYYSLSEHDNISSMDSLQEAYNEEVPGTGKAKINWLKTIQNLFRDVGIRVKETDKILLSDYSFIRRLAHFLKETSKRTIVNYLHWKFVSAMMPYTNKKMRNMNYSLNKFIFGVTKQKPRWEECISENPLKDAVSYQIVHKYLPKKSKEKVLDMAKDIQYQVEIQISNVRWNNDYYRSKAKQKLYNAAKFIGFPDWFNNSSANIEFYKGLRVGPSYFDNILNYNKFTLRKNLGKLGQPINNTWLVDPFMANVHRDFIKNSLIFPATLHQLPLFGASRPNAVNYGALGTIIGQELSKPFSNIGFVDLCIYHQLKDYKKKVFEMSYVTDDDKLDTLSSGSVVVNAGVQTAYEAYQSKLAAEGITEDKLPGLENFSSQQIFFLSFANNWCVSLKLEEPFNNDQTSSEISAERLRVFGPVLNIPEFSEAFQCPKESPMNPDFTCTF